MPLKLSDIKPGDILLYDDEWYALIIQTHHYKKDYLWLSGDSRKERYSGEAFRVGDKSVIPLSSLLKNSRKLTTLDIYILMEELEKIHNDNGTS